MKTLHRYILGELVSYLLISLFFLTFVLLLHKMFQFTDLVVNRGVPITIVAQFLIAALPVLLSVTLLMSILISSIMVFSRMSSDSESLAMTASGMTFYSQLIPVAAVGTVAAVLNGFLMVFGLPWSHDFTSELGKRMLHSRVAAFDLREQVFHSQFDGVMFYVQKTEDSGKTMKGIIISDTREAGTNRVIFAERGMLIKSKASSGIWLRLVGGTVHTVSSSEKIPEDITDTSEDFSYSGDHYQIARFENYDLNFDFAQSIGKSKALRRSLRSFPVDELRNKLKQHEPGTGRYNAILVELQKKFAAPFTCLLLALVGAPLGVRNRRSGRHGGFALSLGVMILYYMLVTFAEGLAESGNMTVSVAVWGPNALLAILAGYLVQTVGRRGAINTWSLLSKPFSLFIRQKT